MKELVVFEGANGLVLEILEGDTWVAVVNFLQERGRGGGRRSKSAIKAGGRGRRSWRKGMRSWRRGRRRGRRGG